MTGEVQKIRLCNVKSINSLRQKGQPVDREFKGSFDFDRNMISNRSK